MRLLSLAHKPDIRQELARVGADPESWEIFEQKLDSLAIRIGDLSVAGANILKQSALSVGADCAVHRAVVSGRVKRSAAVLCGTRRQLANLIDRLRQQPHCVARLVPELEATVRERCSPDMTIRVGRRRLDLGSRTHIMGVLNVTPDSFYDGGRFLDTDKAVEQGLRLADEGADFIDVGAESTRPGSEPVLPREQVRRVAPVIKDLRRQTRVVVSIDTTSAKVARAALDAGARMVNDISGFSFDRGMAKLVASSGVPCVVMHIKGRPRTMQRAPQYDDLMAEITAWLGDAVRRGEEAGVKRSQLIVDPGIGFGKTLEHNLELLRRLTELRTLGRPILVGPSRKSFIGRLLDLGPEERLEGTLGACVVAAMNGASVLRVHDVKQAVRALRVADAVMGRGPEPTEGGG